MPVVVNNQGGSPGEPPRSENGNREGYPDYTNEEARVWLERFPDRDLVQQEKNLRALDEGLAPPPQIGAAVIATVASTEENSE